MRLIDKLLLKVTKPEKYTLLPPVAINLLTREKNVFAFSYDKNLIRALVLNKERKPLLEPFEHFGSDEIPEEEATKLLKQYIEQINVKNIKVGTYIPTYEGILRMYTYPANLTKQELLKSLEIYIHQEIAEVYSNKEVVYKYTILPRKADEPYKVLVAVIESEALNRIKNFAAALGVELDIVSYEPVCILNFAFLKGLYSDFSILYTDYGKVILLTFKSSNLFYEVFYYTYQDNLLNSEEFNDLIWNIRNYIVINDFSNIFLAGLFVEDERVLEIIMEKIPIFGILSSEDIPDRFSLLYTLSARLIHA
jgi:hypothetical protein